ncbi:MAG: 4-(cytidine 5'-diphospho)-2-C-methyl-D-erythritol kinase [Thermoanaerobaculia bacterium]
MRFLSFAKVNLRLEVLRRRADGFHELRTIFQTIDLADEIDIDSAEAGVALEIAGAAGLPSDESNLAWRAAAGFLSRWGRAGEGVRIRLHKRIPIGGGLGGGSSNAATVLAAMTVVLGRSPGSTQLAELAAELGSDVPFFLHGGTALGTGRGELIEPLPDPVAPALELWLAVPPVAAATAAVFAAHRIPAPPARAGARPAGGQGSRAKVAGLPGAWQPLVGGNDLEPTCLALYPGVLDVYNRLSESEALAVRLSGSGSTMFALFANRAAGREAGDRLDNDTIWLPVKTLSREDWRRRSGLETPLGGS